MTTKFQINVVNLLGEAVALNFDTLQEAEAVAKIAPSFGAELIAGPTEMVEKTNLMSGKTYLEAKDTPMCCSPASETYWSM